MNLCNKCAEQQKTCCQFIDIILTDFDITRIEYKGFINFFKLRTPLDFDFRLEDDPNLNLYTLKKNKKMQLVKQWANDDCYFITSNGCMLDLEYRLLPCSLYPYIYNENEILNIYPYRCPKNIITIDHSFLKNEFNLSSENAEKW